MVGGMKPVFHSFLIIFFFVRAPFPMDELNTLENNYSPNISLPNFDWDELQASFDESYTSPVMNQVQGDYEDPICGSINCVLFWLEVPQGEQSVPVLDNTNKVAIPTTMPPVMMQDPPSTSSLPPLPDDSAFCQPVLTYPNCYTEVFVSPNLVVLQRKKPEGGQESLNSELLTFFRSCQVNASRPFLNQVANQRVPRPHSSLPPLLPKPLYPIYTPINNDPNFLPPPVFSSFACSGNNPNPTPNLMYDSTSTVTNTPIPMNGSTLPPPFANSFPTMDTTTSTNTINPINPIYSINPTNTTNTTTCCKAKARSSPKPGKKPAKTNTKSGNTTKRPHSFNSCARQILISWMILHKNHPYCSREEKIELARLTGLEVKQITMWMINSRRRKNYFK